MTPEGAKELRKKIVTGGTAKERISQIDRLKRYKNEQYYPRLKQAFLNIGITEEEILATE